MLKTKKSYQCSNCKDTYQQWLGQCKNCQQWDTITEIMVITDKNKNNSIAQKNDLTAVVQNYNNITYEKKLRFSSGNIELDRVLGGGIIQGMVILIGGDPGIGKSTLLLQTADYLSKDHETLYISGEESLQQIGLRGKRIDVKGHNLNLLAEINTDSIIHQTKLINAKILVIDSIQTLCVSHSSSAPGSVSQIKESTQQLVAYAKKHNIVLFIIGHVTKDGAIAGPKILEHMVDTVLYFEGQSQNKYRAIRAVKNRFGSVNELGIFIMSEKGIKSVENPSAIFISNNIQPSSGRVITSIWEGSRPILIEVQALVDKSHFPNPRRVYLGIEGQRLTMALAILNRHGNIKTYDQDIYINIVGGVKINETAADLAILIAVISSLKNIVIDNHTIILGEIGLSGELRPVPFIQARLNEAQKHGFKKAILPTLNLPKQQFPGLEIVACNKLEEVLKIL